MLPQLVQWGFEGKIKTVVEQQDHANQIVDLGAWQAIVSFGTGDRAELQPNPAADGKLMIVQLSEDKFMLIGAKCHVVFKPAGKNTGKAWQYLAVKEGSYLNGIFKQLRIWNGDETDWGGPHFGLKPTILEVSVIAK
jgi:hypothetical protein